MADGSSWPELKGMMQEVTKTVADVRQIAEEAKSASADVVKTEELKRAEAGLAEKFKEREQALTERLDAMEAKANRPGAPGSGESPAAVEHKTAFEAWMRDPKDYDAERKLREVERKAADVRTLVGGSGGFAVPEEISRQIVSQIRDVSPIRQIARVRSVGTSDYKELVNTRGNTAEWVGETATRSQTDTPDLAEIAPTMGTMNAKPQATVESIDDIFFDVGAMLVENTVELFAQKEGEAFVSGNGTNKPTGFLAGTPVATADATRAFGTLQYVPTGVAAAFSANPFDEIIDLKMTVKAGYRPNGRFVMNSNTEAELAKVKNADGDYILQPAMVMGQPDMLRGSPVTVAEDMPDVAADAFPIAFGDFQRGYLIVDRVGFRIVRDDVTQPGYVKWNMSRRVGGKLKDTNAIKLLKIALS